MPQQPSAKAPPSVFWDYPEGRDAAEEEGVTLLKTPEDYETNLLVAVSQTNSRGPGAWLDGVECLWRLDKELLRPFQQSFGGTQCLWEVAFFERYHNTSLATIESRIRLATTIVRCDRGIGVVAVDVREKRSFHGQVEAFCRAKNHA
jgi:hypothetical protein